MGDTQRHSTSADAATSSINVRVLGLPIGAACADRTTITASDNRSTQGLRLPSLIFILFLGIAVCP